MLRDNKMKEIITTFICAVDLVNPILKHHHRRTAIIAYHIGKECNLPQKSLADLVVAASLHDIGALTVKDSIELATLDVLDPIPHSKLGSGMLSSYKAFDTIKDIILHHHVNYEKYLHKPAERKAIPYEAYILHLADRIEILLDAKKPALNQRECIIEKISNLSKTLFDPAIVDAFIEASSKEYFWFDVEYLSMDDLLNQIDLESICGRQDRDSLEELIFTLSKVVDYKSKFTVAHSIGVAHVSHSLAKHIGFDENRCKEIKIAGYLHDIGKIAIPSEIIAKTDKLTPIEFNIMKAHPYYTYKILNKIDGFERIANWAGSHHERKDRSGYPRKPEREKLGIEIEIITYADIFTALCENRPYRKSLSLDIALKIIREEMMNSIGNRVYSVLEEHREEIYQDLLKIQVKSNTDYYNHLHRPHSPQPQSNTYK